ncbi:uncharacterized protein LOC121521164 [Cheilinus undulatus]|uniref:uncharacterized protein LOC121521164 n=1 Tax=Cheilinus undulatus TaxID=241271 RepID=UPI001BD23A91|nr:uncharacterized protein LOC121521164 [Cheilinus undulatus]
MENRDDILLRAMDEERRIVSWRKFYVHLSGRTNDAHLPWVSRFEGIGQVKVDSAEDSDYILLFCPITSKVGTDISEALENPPAGDKEVILVVMHHTFNRDHVVADSRWQVNDPKVRLVVDTLFFEGCPLQSNRNEIAWDEIKKFLGVCGRAESIQASSGGFIDCLPVKKFYVHLWGKTNGAHLSWVSKFEGIGQVKVDSAEDSDYILLFCPIVSRVGADISEALENWKTAGDKEVILVVMHHTFNRDHVVAESRWQVKDPKVRLVVDTLFFEDVLCSLTSMKSHGMKSQSFLVSAPFRPLVGGFIDCLPVKKFYVHLWGKTNGAHLSWVSKFEGIGQVKVDSAEDSDYILLFCPIVSRVGADISEALENWKTAGDKEVILVVMHHTFNRDHVVAESRWQVKDPKVRLVVDTLFFEGRPLQSNRNEIAWDEITKFLGVRGRAESIQASSGGFIDCLPVKKFYVHLWGKTNGAHLSWVSKFEGIGQVKVESLEDSDYILLFCPIVSRVGADISEALENLPAGDKEVILVVMHHTFDNDHIVADSRRQVNNTNVRLVVDTLFFEGCPLQSDLNEIAWDEIKKFLGVCAEVPSRGFSDYLSWRKFCVQLSGRTNDAHLPWVSRFEGIGQVKVDSAEDSDYILLFCPITSRVGTDISVALENLPAGDKEVILVVMHHTFNKDHIVADSRRQVNNTNVRLVVDTLFFEGRPLECNLNEIAWEHIKKFLGVCAEVPSRGFSDYLQTKAASLKTQFGKQFATKIKWGWPQRTNPQAEFVFSPDFPHVTNKAPHTTLNVDTMQLASASRDIAEYSDDQQEEEEMSENATSMLQLSCKTQQESSASQSSPKPVPAERARKAEKKRNVSQTLLDASQDVDEMFGKQVVCELKQIKDTATKTRLRRNILVMIYDAAEAEQRAASNQSK